MSKAAHKIPQSVLVVIYNQQLDVLLLERADSTNGWQSVTGSKDRWDEDWAVTAQREVWEETSIQIGSATVPTTHLVDWQQENQYEIYPRWRHRYAPGVTHNLERVFSLLVPADIEIRLSPREHTHFIWLPWKIAAEKCFSSSNRLALLHLPQQVGYSQS